MCNIVHNVKNDAVSVKYALFARHISYNYTLDASQIAYIQGI